MRAFGLLILALVLAVAAAGTYLVLNMAKATAIANPPQRADDSGVTDEARAELVQGNNAFALGLYGQLRTERGNIFCSPWSIESVLAMCAEGAAGDTASEILSAGHLPVSPSKRRSAFAALYNALNKPDAEYQLSTANALWMQQDYPLHASYSETLLRHYAGSARNLDFARRLEPSRQTINEWVERQTQQKIKDLFAPGSLDPMTRLVLTNAVYFKGKWVYEFDPERSQPSKFWTAPDESVEVDFMGLYGGDQPFAYAETEQWQAVRLPYKGGDLSMLVLLPRKELSLLELESNLTPAQWQSIVTALQKKQVIVQLPRFKFNSKYTLNDALQSLGMRKAFDAGAADLSGMTDAEQLYVSLVVHQAFVEVNEKGTEAAAATGMAVAGAALPVEQPPLFRADRPFLFAITHDASGAILFLGRVSDPSK